MRRRRRAAHHASHERWLVSYADFITLLFAFFVVLYSTAQVDKKRMVELAAAIEDGFEQMGTNPTYAPAPRELPPVAKAASTVPAPPPNYPQGDDLNVLRKDLEKALAGEIANGEVALRSSPQGLVVSLREAGFFDSGSAGTKASSQPAFGRMTGVLRERSYNIRIEGHTDDVPIHNSRYSSNWELSTARATEMVQLLITKYGFPPESLSAAGYAQFHPVAGNDSETGRAHNRRVDLVILARPPLSESAHPEKPSPERR